MKRRSPKKAPIDWRTRLVNTHRQLQEAMTELIEKKDYGAAALKFGIVDRLMLDLIEDAKGLVVRANE
jgi:hypothetical protein